MKLFNKLANILFDEEVEEEIPVITEEEPAEEKEEEIIVTKVETPKEIKHESEVKKESEITKEIPVVHEEEVQTKKFTFPFIDDDEEEIIPKRSTGKTIEDYSYAATTEEIPVIKKDIVRPREERKLEKSDAYTANRNNIYDPTTKDDHKPFTLSPIISPVYGILNENYTKDDIVERNSKDKEEKIDFDSVRRKAYGTLEDEIEVNLTASNEVEEEPEEDMSIDNLKDDGISISDLLIGDEEEEKTGEIFRVDDIEEEPEVVEGEDEEEVIEVEEEPVEEKKEEVKNKKEKDKTNDEDDLFDLIDSIYAGKDEEE